MAVAVASDYFASRGDLTSLTPREREVLELMALGLSNTSIQQELWISAKTVERHVGAVFAKLDLPPSGDVHRRVTAVLLWLDGMQSRLQP
jgi:DNA-binding CsgD family transcriptional regulator